MAAADGAADRLVDRATALELAVERHPLDIAAEAIALAHEAVGTGDHVAASIASRALGVARRDSGDLDGAAAAFGDAIRHARRTREPVLEGRARISLTGLHIVAGDLPAARAEVARASPLLAPVDRARLEMQLAVGEERAGRLVDAVSRYDDAESVLMEAGDELWLARLRVNRGVALAQLGRLDDAQRDLEAGAHVFEGGDNAAAVTVALNRAWLAGLAADIPNALRRYDDAAALAGRLGLAIGTVERTRATLLTQVGLWEEAVAAASMAIGDLTSANPVDVPEARIVLAQALSGAGVVDAALEAAAQAEREFVDQGRPVWAARAAMARIDATLGCVASTVVMPSIVEDACAAAAALTEAGFATEATEARALAVRAAVAAGRPPPSHLLPLVPPSGPPWTRLRAWHAEGVRRLAEGDPGAAGRAAAAGLDAVDPFRQALGSLELRAGVGASVASVTDLGVALATERGPRALLDWADRRAGTTGLRPADPSEAVRGALAAMRAATSEAAANEDGPQAAVLARRLRQAEAEVRRLDRHGRSSRAEGSGRDAVRASLDRLGPRTLLRYVLSGSEVWLVLLARGRAERRRLGPVAPIAARIDRLRFAVARLAAGGSAAERGRRVLASACDDLATVLVPPRLRSESIVVVPDGPLHGVPWMALGALVGRQVTVAPSVAAWGAASERRSSTSRTPATPAIFVAGPGLPSAEHEVRAAALAWDGNARVLGPSEANVGDVVAGLDSVCLAHFACHGHFRGDSPLFSSLLLTDGPLTVHDLLGLRRAPEVLVLGACDVGESVAVAGAEVLGLAAGCLTAGASTVLASVLPLPDGATAPVLADFVGRFAGGATPSIALAEAVAVARDSDDLTSHAVAASLCCFGAG